MGIALCVGARYSNALRVSNARCSGPCATVPLCLPAVWSPSTTGAERWPASSSLPVPAAAPRVLRWPSLRLFSKRTVSRCSAWTSPTAWLGAGAPTLQPSSRQLSENARLHSPSSSAPEPMHWFSGEDPWEGGFAPRWSLSGSLQEASRWSAIRSIPQVDPSECASPTSPSSASPVSSSQERETRSPPPTSSKLPWQGSLGGWSTYGSRVETTACARRGPQLQLPC